MYWPYLRGKQFELLAIRALSRCFSRSKFVPIVEPVREVGNSNSVSALSRAVDELEETGAKLVLVVNPKHGKLVGKSKSISDFMFEKNNASLIEPGIILDNKTDMNMAMEHINERGDDDFTLIHYGFGQANELARELIGVQGSVQHVFMEPHCGRIYRSHFNSDMSVLMRDGFNKSLSSDYPDSQFFSDLHITYKQEGVTGFGDFLIVGDEFFDSGGAPYAVVLHLTYIDPKQDNVLRIYHFVSESNDTRTDPGRKFLEALTKLISTIDNQDSNVFETDAIREFRDLYSRRHYPGLGKIKEISIRHHVETISHFLSTNN